MPTISFIPSGKRLPVEQGTLLSDACRAAGFSLPLPCGGKGICGKCRVQILRNGGTEWLTACTTKITSDIVVKDPADENITALTAFQKKTTPAHTRTRSPRTATAAAVDLGTTTIAVARCDLSTGEILSTAGAENPQTAFGADVVSRIEYALRSPKNKNELQARAVAKIAELAGDASTVAVAANTVMNHLLLGADASTLATAPFAPAFHGAQHIRGSALGWPGGDPEIYILPNIGAYVGGDVTAGLLAHDILRANAPTLYIDVGTNGEMVLAADGRAFACAVAAGPAFEGARISAGMRASVGAISRVDWTNNEFTCETIGGGEAKGICGSGLLDAVAAFLDAGAVDSGGWMESEEITLCGVPVTQKDVREFQLAKGAVGAGMRVLLERAGVQPSELDRVLLAGGFGTFLRPASALRAGLLPPDIPADRIMPVGNAALAGAWTYLCDPEKRARAQEIADQVNCVELSGAESFSAAFAQEMLFPE